MRGKTTAILAGLLCLIGLLSITPAAYAATYNCTERNDRWTYTWNAGAEDAIVATIVYGWCVNTDPDVKSYVNPKFSINFYDAQDGRLDCSDLTGRLDGFRFNWVMWRPYSGYTYNPGPIEVPCSTDGVNSKTQDYPDVQRLYFGPGYGDDRQPRWKVCVDRMNNNWGDETRCHEQDFRP